MIPEIFGKKIFVKGIVQGVGFRPFVYTLATQLGLFGWVRNTSSGVEIELNGEEQLISQFLERLSSNPPPLARIDLIENQVVAPVLRVE